MGIGLGFNFDHMSKPKPGERLSTRRLQARAAKSAIRRVQEIYDASRASKELDRIKDPQERQRVAAEMRRKAKEEVEFIARRLSELIPMDDSPNDTGSTRMEQFADRKLKKVAPNQYMMNSPLEVSSVIDELKQQSISDDKDDEFVEAWLKQQQQRPSKGAGDEDTIETALA